jgi:hypothetical protein
LLRVAGCASADAGIERWTNQATGDTYWRSISRDKFTNHALYLWLQQETAAIYDQMYEMAVHCARQAERAFNFERGHTARRFIPAGPYTGVHCP